MAKALDAGADINAVGRGRTAPQISVDVDVGCPALRFLLQYQNVNAHVRNRHGRTPLHGAVFQECESCIQRLLDFGVSMTDEDGDGISAFNFAVERCSRTEPLLALLRHATKDRVEGDVITALDRDALYKLCCHQPLRRAHAEILVRCGWSLGTFADSSSSLRLVLDILEEEQWLVLLMLEQPQTILEIRAKVPIWGRLLTAVIDGASKNISFLLKLLRAGIEYEHLKHEIYGLASSEEDHFLLDLLDRKAAGKTVEYVADVTQSNAVLRRLRRLQRTRVIDFLKNHKSGTDTDQRQGEQSIAANEDLNHICSELNAVETQIGREERVTQYRDTDLFPEKDKAKQKQDEDLSRLALASFRHLRVADQLFQTNAWYTTSFHSSLQATL